MGLVTWLLCIWTCTGSLQSPHVCIDKSCVHCHEPHSNGMPVVPNTIMCGLWNTSRKLCQIGGLVSHYFGTATSNFMCLMELVHIRTINTVPIAFNILLCETTEYTGLGVHIRCMPVAHSGIANTYNSIIRPQMGNDRHSIFPRNPVFHGRHEPRRY